MQDYHETSSIMISDYISEELYHKSINPRVGVGDEVFDAISCMTPIVNVDLLIYNEKGQALVTWRDDELCGTGWHLPGGVVRYKETIAERIQKTAIEELHCNVIAEENPFEINEIFMPQNIRGHFISFLFRCNIVDDINSEMIHWYDCDTDVPLVKGQRNIYTKYLNKRYKMV